MVRTFTIPCPRDSKFWQGAKETVFSSICIYSRLHCMPLGNQTVSFCVPSVMSSSLPLPSSSFTQEGCEGKARPQGNQVKFIQHSVSGYWWRRQWEFRKQRMYTSHFVPFTHTTPVKRCSYISVVRFQRCENEEEKKSPYTMSRCVWTLQLFFIFIKRV